MPFASFLMAAHNAAETIGEAISAIRRQDNPDWELIVVDDASCDSTSNVVEGIADRRMSVLRSDINVGRGAARNMAAAIAHGEILIIADADDRSLPHRLSVTRAAFAADARLGVFSGQIRDFGPWGGPLQRSRFPVTASEIAARARRGHMPLAHCAAAIRAETFHRHGGYDNELRRVEDMELFRRLAADAVPMQGTEEVLVDYRTGKSVSWSYWRENARYRRLANQRVSARLNGRAIPDLSQLESGLQRPATAAVDLAWWLYDKTRKRLMRPM